VRNRLKVAASVVCLAACALIGILWVISYWRAFTLLAPSGHCFVAVEGRCSVSKAFCEYVNFDGPNLEHYATHKLHGWVLDRWTILRAMRIPEDRNIKSFVPFWFPFLLVASLAIAPWLRWRFGIRTLMLVITVWAVSLGLLAM
jgi:hypothetical protein